MDISFSALRAGLLGAAVMAVLVGGCGSVEPADRSGGEVVHLQFASIDDQREGQDFIRALAEVSRGRMIIDVMPRYGHAAPAAEAHLVSAIADGEVDGGWPASRAFAEGGIPGLQAIESPLAITSYAALSELVTAPAADRVLATLGGSGVVGLGMIPLGLRRPFSSDSPLLEPADWKGITFRSHNSPVQSATIEALGGTPTIIGPQWQELIADGKLRGGDMDVEMFLRAGFASYVEHAAANVVLWPKVGVLSLSQKRYDSLTGTQREWLRRAAARALTAALASGTPEQQDAAAQELCTQGVELRPATKAQLADLDQAVEPVRQRLRADPASAGVMAVVDAIAAQHEDPDALHVPTRCKRESPAPKPRIPTDVAGIPDGIYRTEIPAAAVLATGDTNDGGWSGIWTLTISAGTYTLKCRPLDLPGRDCGNAISDVPFEAGHLRGTGSTVWFVYDADLHSAVSGCKLPTSFSEPDHCSAVAPYSATWTVSGDELTFSDSSTLHLVLEPWRRIG
jgi:TRAP-type C4-dicarboxylate transport system substrate-binding protein